MLTRLALAAAIAFLAGAHAGEVVFVEDGKPKAVRVVGEPWRQGDGYIKCGGTGNYLYAGQALGDGDFRIEARLTILKLARSAASFTFAGGGHFGFEGSTGKMFVQGPLFGGKTRFIGQAGDYFEAGRPFTFEVMREGPRLTIRIEGKVAYESRFTQGAVGLFGFRPWRSTVRVHRFAATGNLQETPPMPTLTDVFRSGQDGYHTYRIPSVIVTPKGDLLAFCEGRKHSRSDTGDIDIVSKRSTDGGMTWSEMDVIADHGPHVIGNPCPVIDQATGTLWMPLTRNRGDENEGRIKKGTSKEPRTVWLMKSTDDGHTWSEPVNISDMARDGRWRWYATG
ncbi:MAG: exo-alpha-sialidase, partial [Planctomycetota bacterium]